eukprot:TRINITY_DN21315_c0_g1_i1.p1 TRINITY_DN21315_c0_g1~~TRINITY_DN21315_c0_g1_i1.p1  ORF type:complete len:249 (+),score=83.41 TRINITY_DN21315_c0_g1_i1:52-798(+)
MCRAVEVSAPAPKTKGLTGYTVIDVYNTANIFDAFVVVGVLVLGVCYAWARSLGHVGVFCDISDLGVHLPERILFRLDLSILGGLLFYTSWGVRDITKWKVPSIESSLPDWGGTFQRISGFALVGVAACAENEISALHVTFAVLGFGGAAISQLLFAIVLRQEDTAAGSCWAKAVYYARLSTTACFLLNLLFWGLGQLDILPEPTEHICEWGMFFCIALFFFSFRLDIDKYYIATAVATGADDNEACP